MVILLLCLQVDCALTLIRLGMENGIQVNSVF